MTSPVPEQKKCEDMGFKHLWKDTTSDIVFATFPPSYPPKERTCENCGKKEVERLVQREIKEWRSLPKEAL